ncbi:hypothetical protein CGLO_11689 [Colletotrichum gloeosporioides Cg-14]|uniref:Uncharacterized protein n=1 Tax=Colletotrichum gloeosporioides (strain Cg-14) TaxID=1237896 RepID=T0K7R2_COLGC|nr:hypothetical protein CGLO_11689 [Colletotrichum gloeosporioides Cg-14]
MAVANLYDI